MRFKTGVLIQKGLMHRGDEMIETQLKQIPVIKNCKDIVQSQ